MVELRLIADAQGLNRPDGIPVLRSMARFNPPIAMAHPSEKQRHTIQLLVDGGIQNSQAILGMPENSVWTLCGSDMDKTMLRNYLAYTLAGEIRPGQVPEARYCEVLYQVGGQYIYQGVYLLSEYVPNGIWITPRSVAGMSYIACPVEQDTEETPAPSTFLRFETVYPNTGDNAAEGTAAAAELAGIKQSLDSNVTKIYFRYMRTLDVGSFIDSYIITVIMMNYDGDFPFYCFKKGDDERIGLSPKWIFNQALDNSVIPAAELDEDIAPWPWFNQLFLSADFVDALRHRYFQLLRGPLNPEKLDAMVDEAATLLGDAVQRDWLRWRDTYATASPAPARAHGNYTLERRTFSPEQEVLKIKHNLRFQGSQLRNQLVQMRWRDDLFRSDMNSRRNLFLLVVFLAAFFLITIHARRKM